MASAATPAIKALQAAGISYEVRQFRHDPRATSFGDEAVNELAAEGFVAAQIFKTLVLAIPGGLAVAVLPVPDKLSFKAAAAALGVPKADMADQAAAQRSTGYVVGGISPLGQRKLLPTVVDQSALDWERVLCSAGKRGLDIVLAPGDLIRLTGAVTADICAQ
ncbi:aminoacyl-tRNA deacylase [Mycobacterium sp. CBMA 234]|uniref:aminoacyl-tRNA deacylase n=1 Tax=Mycolicibacterium sp. CBMA 234 TaxID=1918495 RepID=UPI0012DDFFB6|nr:aminoacyl-tRNA deacylase [Mycolicibacterium sp. CBMA 234]MUL67588.1 aminoacyl-tRNA deacylase [Mycolicibacterium sp. CBMA 234]